MPEKTTESISKPSHTNPVVTIIIPFHNRERMINELLESIPDIPEIEVIAIEDHSTDNVEIKVAFKKAVFRHLFAPKGQRYAGSARNQGMREAQGKYLFFADSDDLIASERFMDCIHKVRGRNDVDVFYTRLNSFIDETCEPGTRHIASQWLISRAAHTGNKDFLFRVHAPMGKFIRRDFVEKNGLRYCETVVSNDVMFNFHLCAAEGSTEFFDDVAYSIRQGNDSLTTSTPASLDRIWTRFEVQEDYNRGLIKIGKAHLRSPGIVYVRQALRLNWREGSRMLKRCLTGPTPVIALVTSLRFRLGRKIWPTGRR